MNILLFVFGCFIILVNSVPTVSNNKLDNKIVGGELANIKDYPYQVSLQYFNYHSCGGSILDATTILTAAHCVYMKSSAYLTVRVGSSAHDVGGEVHEVSKVVCHNDYDDDTVDYDIAIIKLAKPLKYSTNVQPIPLQESHREVPEGTTAWVSGWGVTSPGDLSVSDFLRSVDVEIVSTETCAIIYQDRSSQITDRMLCAQTINHDSCQGDSGGPLVANGKLIGIVSWGYGCADTDYPGVYTKISNFRTWIILNRY